MGMALEGGVGGELDAEERSKTHRGGKGPKFVLYSRVPSQEPLVISYCEVDIRSSEKGP